MISPVLGIFTVLLLLISGTQSAKILQITDFHMDINYNTSGDEHEMCHWNPKVRDKLGRLGNYLCDSPMALVRYVMKAAQEVILNPDLLLLTGDFIPHISDYNLEYVSDTVKIVNDYVSKHYPKTVILPVLGNHDAAPSNYYPNHNGTIYRIMYDLWRNWIGPNNEDTFLKGGYYKYYWTNRSVVVVLNTNLYYIFNGAIKDFENKSDPAGQFAFLVSTLEEAKASGKTVHIAAHIAPGVFERTPFFAWLEPQYNQRLIDITVKYASTIGWMIFGHHHTDTFHIVTDPVTRQPVQVYLMSPSVTPWFSNLSGAGSQNPSFRIYDMDENTQQFTDAALKNGDDETWKKYIEYNSVGWNVSMPKGIFRSAQLCSIEHPDLINYVYCMPTGLWSTPATQPTGGPAGKIGTTTPKSAKPVVPSLLGTLLTVVIALLLIK